MTKTASIETTDGRVVESWSGDGFTVIVHETKETAGNFEKGREAAWIEGIPGMMYVEFADKDGEFFAYGCEVYYDEDDEDDEDDEQSADAAFDTCKQAAFAWAIHGTLPADVTKF